MAQEIPTGAALRAPSSRACIMSLKLILVDFFREDTSIIANSPRNAENSGVYPATRK